MPQPNLLSRRSALRLSALGASLCLAPRILKADTPAAAATPTPPPSPRMRLAFIGCGNQAMTHVESLARHDYIAFADVDDRAAAKAASQHPGVPKYRDFRVMLDRHAKDVDAVVITTPDHSHFPAALFSLAHGKHIHVEKPLTNSIWEARQLTRVAKASGLKTQMGVQGHSMGGLRLLKEWVDAGAVGPIREVFLYTDRMQLDRYHWADQIEAAETVPQEVSWDLWLAGRAARPYNHQYMPDRWRNWWDFGTGPIGNVGVHMLDTIEYVLELGYPDWIEGHASALSPHTWAPWSTALWHFPAKSARGAVDVHWNDGFRDGKQVRPEQVGHVPREIIDKVTNCIALVGPEGTLFIDDMRASTRPRIFPEAREKEFLAAPPKPTLARPKGLHIDGLFRAIADNTAAPADFSYSGPLTEVALLGNLAERVGKRIEWDHAAQWPKGFALDDPFLKPVITPEWMPGV